MNKSGLVLVMVGVVLLAHNFDLLSWGWLHKWWPAFLIGLGLWSIVSHKPDDRRSNDTDKADKAS